MGQNNSTNIQSGNFSLLSELYKCRKDVLIYEIPQYLTTEDVMVLGGLNKAYQAEVRKVWKYHMQSFMKIAEEYSIDLSFLKRRHSK
jgi:hypothetical protein